MPNSVENGAKSPVASDSDPVSSLRAAALLTLKSKRRKPIVDTSGASGPSQRPPPTDTSVQLDYGQDDVGSSPTDVAMPPLKRDPEDGQTREEGEISDSEEAQSKPASKRSLDTPTVVKVESPTHNLLDRIRDPPHPGPSLTPVPFREFIIDADHVRPGLSMNQDQYDTAKDIVLDLLGWGVPPDYLVDCNLSREIVYYVFSELNLRLPRNLDVTDLVPYTPAHMALYAHPLSATPPRPEASTSSRPLHGHPSLPPKPLAGSNAVSAPVPGQQRSTAPSPPPTSSPPTTSPANQNSSAPGSLHDMERQRRQELLARKAVQASRKIKPPSDASSTASSSHAPDPADQSGVQDQDVEMTAVATEAVDDFLKSIGEKSATPEAQPEPESTNSMDIDEIPGLGGSSSRNTGSSSFYGTAPESQMPSYTEQVVISPAESSFSAAHLLPQTDAPPSSGDSGSTTSSALEHNSQDTERLSHQHQGLQRRGSKRPTAADFVDFDPGSRNGFNNNDAMPHPLKRKMASFASVSGHRKLVIDLSDSEGEGAEDYVMHEADWENGSGYSSPAGWPSMAAGGRSTPPASMTPAALMEKEQQIRNMRELIAQREMSRKQKAMSRSATVASVEREEEASVANGSVPRENGFHLDGTTPLAVSDKRALTDAALAGSASTSSPATPPNIDSEDHHGGGTVASTNGAQDSETAGDVAQDEPVNNRSSSQEALQEPLVDVDSASSSSAQVRLANTITDVASPPKTRRKSFPVAGGTTPRRQQQQQI
ncbi:hypothetical protein B0H12DRAFT_1108572 [Mycena haematopus]|nr:hypothetical protein B0H12DRAFT_1108572 [Mycena haematopus]